MSHYFDFDFGNQTFYDFSKQPLIFSYTHNL